MKKFCKFMATFYHTDGTHTSKFFETYAIDVADAKSQIDEIYSEPCEIYCFQMAA